MASMVVFTEPDTRVLQASADLAERTGTSQKAMAGAPCSRTVRCRNASGEPLCHNLCPARMAARARSGVVDVPVWLEEVSGRLVEHRGRFEQVPGLTNGAVVAFFSEVEPADVPNDEPPANPEIPKVRSAALRVVAGQGAARRVRRVASEPRSARRRPTLRLVSG